jgi:tetratricopeptide (TPR) repeat protein
LKQYLWFEFNARHTCFLMQDAQQQARGTFGLGVAEHMLGHTRAAISAFGQAAQLAEGSDLRVRALVSQATLYKREGETEAAVELLQEAAKLEPKVWEIYLKPLLEADQGGKGRAAGKIK